MAKQLYSEVRKLMSQRGITNHDIAVKINRSDTYVSLRFNGHLNWDQDDMYIMMDMFHLPYELLHVAFPRNGGYAGELFQKPLDPGAKLAVALRDFGAAYGMQL